ncbi:hypothetical protein C8K61_11052 [Pseudomonas sp. GV071]|nr:hypothetical protein C8K61_11052 [Pseudomonas sp. GV071]
MARFSCRIEAQCDNKKMNVRLHRRLIAQAGSSKREAKSRTTKVLLPLSTQSNSRDRARWVAWPLIQRGPDHDL